jgi:hypothetical protein
MLLDAISEDFVLELLKAIAHHEDPPVSLFDLHSLKAISDQTPGYSLKDHILQVTYSALKQLRDGQSPDKPIFLPYETACKQVAGDFRNGSEDLQAWSVIYHRYLCGSTVSVNDMAKHAAVNPRQINRRERHGLRLLVEVLRSQEATEHAKLKQRTRGSYMQRPSTARLFGRETLVNAVVNLLTDPTGPLIVSLSGMGGGW